MTEETAPYVIQPQGQMVASTYVPPTPEKKAFLLALAKAQGSYEPIVKNAHVIIKPRDSAAYEFDYADLAEILAKTRAALSANGLSTRAKVVAGDKGFWLQSIVAHCDGYEDISEMPLSLDGDMKIVGGRISYERRYLLGPQLGVAGEGDIDDDGVAAGDGANRVAGRPPAPEPRKTPQPRAAAQKPAAAPAPAPAPAPVQPGNVATQENPETGNVATETDPRQEQLPIEQPTGEVVTKSQAKWLKGKLDAGPFTDAERDKWLADRGIKSFEMLPVERFAAVNAELLALE